MSELAASWACAGWGCARTSGCSSPRARGSGRPAPARPAQRGLVAHLWRGLLAGCATRRGCLSGPALATTTTAPAALAAAAVGLALFFGRVRVRGPVVHLLDAVDFPGVGVPLVSEPIDRV